LPTAASVTSIAVSADGNRLAYINTNELWVVDRAAQSNWVVATDVPSYRAGPQFSGDGRYLVYATSGVNDTNGGNAVYRYDFQANTSQLISPAGQTGSVGVGSADWPAISWDGRFVAYRGVAAVPGAFPQIYLYDSQSNSTTLLSSSVLAGREGNNRSLAPTFSGDSTTVFFRTWASDLLTNDLSGSGGLDALTVAVYPPALVGAIQFSSGGLPVISWPAVSGKNYQAQYKNNLADPFWQTLPGAVTVVSNTGWVTDPQPASPQRFYRVQSN
jgi:Tol biopolymer transport system component